MCFSDVGEREEALRYGKVYDIHGSPPYADQPVTLAMARKLDNLIFITVSDNDPLRDKILAYVVNKGSGVGVDYTNSIPHFVE